MTPEERLRHARENPAPYEDRYLALVDVLGWSDIIARSITDRSVLSPISEAAELMSMAPDWADETNQITQSLEIEGFNLASDVRSSNFSDHFAISVPVDDVAEVTFQFMVVGICNRLLECEHYTRGAIVRGLVRHTRALLYGPALVEAHRLESQVAKYPRILIAPEAEPAFRTFRPRCDFDGMKHLDILNAHKPDEKHIAWLEGLLAMAERRATEDAKCLDRVAKHRWFGRYVEEKLALARREAG